MEQAKLKKNFPHLALFRIILIHPLVPEGVVLSQMRWHKAEAIAQVGVAATNLRRQIILHKNLKDKMFYLISRFYLLHICNSFVRIMKGVSGTMVLSERESLHFRREDSLLKHHKWVK